MQPIYPPYLVSITALTTALLLVVVVASCTPVAASPPFCIIKSEIEGRDHDRKIVVRAGEYYESPSYGLLRCDNLGVLAPVEWAVEETD